MNERSNRAVVARTIPPCTSQLTYGSSVERFDWKKTTKRSSFSLAGVRLLSDGPKSAQRTQRLAVLAVTVGDQDQVGRISMTRPPRQRAANKNISCAGQLNARCRKPTKIKSPASRCDRALSNNIRQGTQNVHAQEAHQPCGSCHGLVFEWLAAMS